MNKLFVLYAISVVFVSGCQPSEGTIQTAIAQTQIAAPTVTLAPSPTATVPVPTTLTILAEVPCRAGPGDAYDLIVNLQAGEKVEIVGKADSYWIVKASDGSECWVADQVDSEGDVFALPNVDIPPTPAPALPAAPEHVGLIKVKCSIDHSVKPNMYVNEFWLGWTDMSNNEDGFRIYRDGDLAAEVTANRTDVIDVVVRLNNRVHYYSVSAYNENGESKSEVKAFSCGK